MLKRIKMIPNKRCQKMRGFLFFLLLIPSLSVAAREPVDKPNIIFILIDDLGKEWLNCYGGENIETPQIDALAKAGIKFDNAYSMPQCTPSRACFLTGQYPYRNGWVNHWDSPRWGVGYLDWTMNPSIARTMQSAGYATATAGKWQLNDFRLQPNAMVEHGFDEYCMWTGAEGAKDKEHLSKSTKRYWSPYIHTKLGSKSYEGKFGPDIYNDFLLNFMTENKDKPFFVYYPMALTHSPLVHTPLEPDVTEKYDKHKAMVRYTDLLLGKIVEHLEQLKIRKNTIIIWTCDNGTSGGFTNAMSGRSVQGGKTKTTENGVNTPFIVSCPGLIPEGKTSKALIDFTDMHKTFADLAGATPDPKYTYDGNSVKNVFLGKENKSKRSWIMAMGSQPAKITEKGVENVYYFRDRVVRDERYKLYVGTDRKVKKLVDLKNDPEELNDLKANQEYKKVLDRLAAVIDKFPVQDKDPSYKTLSANAWDRKVNATSQVHKKDKPDYVAPKKSKRSAN